MAAAHQINVHASLPRTVTPGGDIDVDLNNWQWTHCLTFPLETLNALHDSQRSYKWIRYAIGVVVGTEGILSASPDLPVNAVDYDDDLLPESINLYYHTSIQERERAFPIDPDIARTQITSSVHTDRRRDFRAEVLERDRGQCVLTGFEADMCDAAHLIGHSKGDDCIATYTQRRSRDPAGGDIIRSIDDVRNGLFLNTVAHTKFGVDFAFLMTPNFAMNTDDVDPAAPPDEKRCTSQIFGPVQNTTLRACFSPGSQLQLLDARKDPPAIIFDAVYASAVLRHFGTQPFKDVLLTAWKDIFRPHGVMSAAEADQRAIIDAPAIKASKREADAVARTYRREDRCRIDTSHSGPDMFDALMLLPNAHLSKDNREAMFRRAREKAEAAEKERLQYTVGPWARDVEGST